jgi:hypothetical protein
LCNNQISITDDQNNTFYHGGLPYELSQAKYAQLSGAYKNLHDKLIKQIDEERLTLKEFKEMII